MQIAFSKAELTVVFQDCNTEYNPMGSIMMAKQIQLSVTAPEVRVQWCTKACTQLTKL